MAQFKSEVWTVKIKPVLEYDDAEYIGYYLSILYKGKSILNSEMFAESTSINKVKAPKNSFLFFEHGGDTLLHFFTKALTTKKPIYTSSLEPDFMIMAHPNLSFPFINEQQAYWAGAITAKTKTQYREKFGYDKEKIQLVIWLNCQYLVGSGGFYTDDGFAYHLLCNKSELKEFVESYSKEIAPISQKVKENSKRKSILIN